MLTIVPRYNKESLIIFVFIFTGFPLVVMGLYDNFVNRVLNLQTGQDKQTENGLIALGEPFWGNRL